MLTTEMRSRDWSILGAGVLLGTALSGCGDVSGEPIYGAVPVPPPDTTLDPPITVPQFATPVGGLCTACADGDDCGGGDDYCVVNDLTGERFCARQCVDNGDCPGGYECAPLTNSDQRQCAPLSGGCAHVATKEIAPSIEVQRAYALDAVNQVRLDAGVAPLVSDECLTKLAQASCEELARTGVPRGLFGRECNDAETECHCGWQSEQEVSIAGLGLEWRDAIDAPIDELVIAAPGGDFQAALLAIQFSRLGVGLVLSGDEAWTCFAYAE
jgi:hypothetical protein